ncbi:MAG: LysR family transcriptional regulator [Pseudoflavonifractor sp.]
MTLKQIEYFLEIAKMGGITKAAQNLNISQPPLSLQLKSLEEELGAQLFYRNNRKLEITPEGKLFRERAQAILGLLEETTRDIRAVSEERQVIIRIATIGSVNNRLLPEKIAQFCREYPYVSFRVIEGTTEMVLGNLAEGKADLGFAREPFNMTSFRAVPIQDPILPADELDYFVTIAQPHFYNNFYAGVKTDSIPLEDLQGKPLVTHRRYREMLVSACRKKGFNPHIICENNEIQSSLSWARAGIGMAVAPYTSAAYNSDPELVIRRLDSMTFSPRACLVWNQSVKLTSEALAFIGMV